MLRFIKRILVSKTFKDGSTLKNHSKESMLYTKGDLSLEILFYFDDKQYQIYLPALIDQALKADLKAKVTQYCDERGYRFSILAL